MAEAGIFQATGWGWEEVPWTLSPSFLSTSGYAFVRLCISAVEETLTAGVWWLEDPNPCPKSATTEPWGTLGLLVYPSWTSGSREEDTGSQKWKYSADLEMGSGRYAYGVFLHCTSDALKPWGLVDSGDCAPSRVSKFLRIVNNSPANPPIQSPYPRPPPLSNSYTLDFCPNHSRARDQTPGDSPYVPEAQWNYSD